MLVHLTSSRRTQRRRCSRTTDELIRLGSHEKPKKTPISQNSQISEGRLYRLYRKRVVNFTQNTFRTGSQLHFVVEGRLCWYAARLSQNGKFQQRQIAYEI